MRNLGIFTILVYLSYLSLSISRAQGILRNLSNMYDRLCNTGIFRTQGILRPLSNIYDEKVCSQSCVTPRYLEPWHIQNRRHVQKTAKHLARNILFKTFCNPEIFRTLVYSELWYILKSKHIKNPAKYISWNMLLRTLCR